MLIASGCTWTSFRSNPANTGVNENELTISSANVSHLDRLWTADAEADFTSSTVVAKGLAYLATSDRLFAYNARGTRCASTNPAVRCAPVWSATIAPGALLLTPSTPTVAGDVVYVGSHTGVLSAFDAAGVTGCSGTPKTCTPLWTAQPQGGGIDGSPVVVDGVVYVNAGVLAAYDASGTVGCSGTPKTCEPMWTSAVSGSSTPAVVDGVLYTASNGMLLAYDASGTTGCSGTPKVCNPIWSSGQHLLITTPAVADGVVHVGAGDGQVYAFDAHGVAGCTGVPTECAPLWSGTTGGRVESPAVHAGVVYYTSHDFTTYAFDASGTTPCTGSPTTCTPIWTYRTQGRLFGSPIVANGLLYVSSYDGMVYAFDATGVDRCGGTNKRCAPVFASNLTCCRFTSPTLAGGVLYLGGNAFALSEHSVTFSYNGTDGSDGAVQTWTVPPGVTSIVVDAYGAGGGGSHLEPVVGGVPGGGGHARATLAVTPGEVLRIRVGGDPDGANGGFNGGGRGGTGVFTSGAGGGATDVRRAGDTLSDRVVVAGGGGGNGTADLGSFGTIDLDGGNGGGTAGAICAGALTYACGTGGTQSGGGTGGDPSGFFVGPFCRAAGTAGKVGQGADGGQCTHAAACGGTVPAGTEFGGGGGGGWFGGGSGAVDSGDKPPNPDCGLVVGAGGGGSGFITPAATATLLEAGVGFGDGHVTIKY